MKKNWVRITLIVLVSFSIGAFLGRRSVFFDFPQSDGYEKRMAKKFERFSRHLDLSAEQKEKIRVIFDEKRETYRALKEKWTPEKERIRKEARDQINALLNDQQRAKFKGMEAKREKWREKWKSRRRAGWH